MRTDAMDFVVARLGCFLALLDQRPQVLNILGLCRLVVGKFDLDG